MRGRSDRQHGVTLVELVVFIVIVSVSVAGVLIAIDRSARSSAQPLVIKQALAIAEALLEEVQLMPFTYCDPDDVPVVSPQTSGADCTGGAGGVNDETRLPLGPDPGESRYSASNPFDNVNDYNGFNTVTDALPGIRQIDGTLITELAAYTAAVTVVASDLGTITQASGNALLITVTVTGPANTNVVLQGYSTRYAPSI